MIIKKLAVPLVNEKLLQQAEHCYIATAALSEQGFDFIRSRIPTKTKMDIVTGLDEPTSPEVLRRIWRNYGGRIALNIYHRNTFHANLYIFDLPFRKSIAFLGSGACTLEGLKDGEELFYKITDAKEIENLKSWFIGYFEFGEPLNESHIQEYELRYPVFKQRALISRQEKKQFVSLTAHGFQWEQLNLKSQFFKKEDYQALDSRKAHSHTPELQTERENVQAKLRLLHEQLQPLLKKSPLVTTGTRVDSLNPADHPDGLLRSLRIALDLSVDNSGSNCYLGIGQKEVFLGLAVGLARSGQRMREQFKISMGDPTYRKKCYELLAALGPSYQLEVGAERRPIETFANEDVLWEFLKGDQWTYFPWLVERSFAPNDRDVSQDSIAQTFAKEIEKLTVFFQWVTSDRV